MRPMTRFHHRKRSGATTVEFAITIPILLLILFTTLEFSRMNVIRQTAVNAAYEGARRGIVPGSTANEVQQIATSVLDTVGVHGSTVTVTPTVLTPDTTEVTVDVTIPVAENGWLSARFFAGKNVATSCTLRRELVETVVVP